MKNPLPYRLGLALGCLLPLFGYAQAPTFTYQGRLETNGVPVSGAYTFQPTLWDAASGGNLVAGNSPTTSTVAVSNGLFVLALNFGPGALNAGEDRWLQLEMARSGESLSPLTPRQPLTSAPYAYRAARAGSADAVSAANVTGTLSPAQLPADVLTNHQTYVTLTGSFSGDGAGLINLNAWGLGGNLGTVSGGDFLGTLDNQPLELRVNNQRRLRLDTSANVIAGSSFNEVGPTGVNTSAILSGIDNQIRATSSSSVIVGGNNNAITNGVDAVIGGGLNNLARGFGATIGGGVQNSATADRATVSGGAGNAAGWDSSFVGGGMGNTAANGGAVVVGGDQNNNASVDGFIGAGRSNTIATTISATIAGGEANQIAYAASYAAIPGGQANRVAGEYGFAAGRRAKANHSGAFVWADAQNTDYASTASNQFLVRASGGVGINNNNPTAALHVGGTAGVDGIRFPDGTLQTTAATPSESFAAFASGLGNNPATTNNFLAAPATVTLTSPRRILITSHKALGSTVAGGANNLDLFIGYRFSGGAITTVGLGILGNRVAQNTRVTMGLSALTPILPAGTYEVGLVGRSSNATDWNSNEYSYTTAAVY